MFLPFPSRHSNEYFGLTMDSRSLLLSTLYLLKRYYLILISPFITFCFRYNLSSTLPPSTVNSNAFADMDGDCKADLIVSTLDQNGLPVVQIYINSPAGSTLNFIQPTMTLPSQSGMGQLTIADYGNISIQYSDQKKRTYRLLLIRWRWNQ